MAKAHSPEDRLTGSARRHVASNRRWCIELLAIAGHCLLKEPLEGETARMSAINQGSVIPGWNIDRVLLNQTQVEQKQSDANKAESCEATV